MDVFSSCQKRRSCRKYLTKPVEFEKLTVMIESGTLAPSAGNLQQWKFMIITNKDKINNISNFSYQQFWIAKSPAIIAVCSICEKQEKFYGKRGSKLYSIQSAAAAIENMLLVGASIGLGTCWIGGFEEGRVKDILQIPTNVNLHALITVGYPDEIPNEKAMAPLESCVYFDTYGMPIKKINQFLNDYSIEFERIAKDQQPKVEKLLKRLKQIKDDMVKKK